MENWLSLFLSVGSLITCVTVFGGCSSIQSRDSGSSHSEGASVEKNPMGRPESPSGSPPLVSLELKGEPGRKERLWYYSSSVVETREDGQLTRRKDEDVEFVVESRFKEAPSGTVLFESETIRKDGPVRLHDLAYPELGDKIEMALEKTRTIKKAGDYPSSSVFFVPPIALPKNPVRVGDTWTLTHAWASMSNGIPLLADLVFIFSSVHPCGEGRCADLEVSGEVSIAGNVVRNIEFSSQVRGHLLFSIEQGSVVASRIANREEMKAGETVMSVSSCMEGQMQEPQIRVKDLNLKPTPCVPGQFKAEYF